MIYNYKGEWFNESFGLYAFSSTVLFIILIFGIFEIIKHWRIEGKQLGWLYIVGSILIMAIPIFVFTFESKKLYAVLSYNHSYKTQNYQEISGKLNIISLEVEEPYDDDNNLDRYFVTFSIDNKTIESFYPISEVAKIRLTNSNEKTVLVRYIYDDIYDNSDYNDEAIIFEILESDGDTGNG